MGFLVGKLAVEERGCHWGSFSPPTKTHFTGQDPNAEKAEAKPPFCP